LNIDKRLQFNLLPNASHYIVVNFATIKVENGIKTISIRDTDIKLQKLKGELIRGLKNDKGTPTIMVGCNNVDGMTVED